MSIAVSLDIGLQRREFHGQREHKIKGINKMPMTIAGHVLPEESPFSAESPRFKFNMQALTQVSERKVHCACKIQCSAFLELELMTGVKRERKTAGPIYEAQNKAL